MIGRIYKIQHLDSSLCYIGSTCNTIRDRWRWHKSAFGQWVKNKDRVSTVALYPFLEQYGVDRFQMLLIKEYQVADKVQIKAYEQLAISRTKLCCNRNAALQLISPKSLAKHYRQGISEQSKDYYQANKQAFRDHYQANKDVILKRSKDHYQANKQSIKEYKAIRVMCECGTESRKDGISAHRKSAKHARLLAALNTQ
mgnify:CR=1 FL=1